MILIPLGHTDHWLLWAMARSLGDTLGVPVSVQDACIELPAPTRDRLSRMQTEILKHMQTTLGDPEKARPLQAMGIRREDIRSADDAVKALRATTLAGGGEAALKELDAVLEAARGADPQWHTDPLLATLQERTQAMKKPSVFYLGVVGVDVFMDRSNFAFGTALVGAGYGVMSYRRFTADFSAEPPDSARLLARTTHPPPPDPPRHPPHRDPPAEEATQRRKEREGRRGEENGQDHRMNRIRALPPHSLNPVILSLLLPRCPTLRTPSLPILRIL